MLVCRRRPSFGLDSKDLYGVPVVITANRTTANLDYLTENDFLGNAGNRVVVRFPPAAPGQAQG